MCDICTYSRGGWRGCRGEKWERLHHCPVCVAYLLHTLAQRLCLRACAQNGVRALAALRISSTLYRRRRRAFPYVARRCRKTDACLQRRRWLQHLPQHIQARLLCGERHGAPLARASSISEEKEKFKPISLSLNTSICLPPDVSATASLMRSCIYLHHPMFMYSTLEKWRAFISKALAKRKSSLVWFF